MNIATAQQWLNILSVLAVVWLAVDTFYHRVIGKAPLEAQMIALRKMIEEGNERSSKKATELTVYLDDRRIEVGILSERISAIEGELRGMRNQTSDGNLIEERRSHERRRT